MDIMPAVDQILLEIEQLSPEDQSRLFHELNHKVLARRFRDRASQGGFPLPVSDFELDQIVHETRREVLRARDL